MDEETLALFEDALARFSRERYPASRLCESLAAQDADEDARWQAMSELGWFELASSEGVPPNIVPLLSIYREAGQGLWRDPIGCVFGESAVVAARAADPALRNGLANGTAPLCVATREPGRDAHEAPTVTRARTRPEGTVLSGRKVAAPYHPRCAAFLVTAVDERSGRCAYYRVEPGARGLALSCYRTAEGRTVADLELERTPVTLVVAQDADLHARCWTGMLAAAECVGIMRGALNDTMGYLRQRKQFGRALIEFQALQHRLAEMRMLSQETDALLRDLGADLDAGLEPDERACWVLRAQASRAALHVTREAVQLHGGMGVTQECRVSHYYRRVLTLESLQGSGSWALDRLS